GLRGTVPRGLSAWTDPARGRTGRGWDRGGLLRELRDDLFEDLCGDGVAAVAEAGEVGGDEASGVRAVAAGHVDDRGGGLQRRVAGHGQVGGVALLVLGQL